MASTGAKFPTSSSSTAETPWDDAAWFLPSNIYASDGSGTSVAITSGQQTQILRGGGFDLSSIPDAATIDGVEVVVRGTVSGTDGSIALVQLLDTSGAKVGTNKASTPTSLTGSLYDYTFGGATDLWGNSLTSAWLKDADFGVAVGVSTSAGGTPIVDSITVNVYYTLVPKTYYVVYESTATDPADNSTGYGQIIAGQDGSGAAAAASGSIVAPTADATDSALATITGLDASTEYVAAAVWWDGASDYGAGRILSAGITTSAAATAVGLATETDSALALSALQIKATGRADETDTAIALAAVQIQPAGLATEADTALALAAVQIAVAGLAVESDTAFALGSGVASPIGLAVESDAALALPAVQLGAVGLAAEADSALALSPVASSPVGLSTEADSALALAAVQSAAAGLATETDTALALAAVQIAPVGLSVETDTALALEPSVPGVVGLAVETDAALALAGVQIRAVGFATETDTALALPVVQVGGVGLVLEIDAAFALVPLQIGAVGRADETDAALALTSPGGTASAAEVWDYLLSNGMTAGDTLVAVHAMLIELHQVHGLELGSPLTVTETQRTAAAITQAIAELSGVVTVTRQ